MVPHASHLTRRFVRAGLVGLLVTAAAVAVAPPVAQAAGTTAVTSGKSAYVDSQHPDATHLNPGANLPVGRLGDDVSRAYYSFDLSAFQGRTIGDVVLFGAETQAADCVHRSVELWTTGPLTRTSTWTHQPAWLQKVSTAGYLSSQGCPAPYLEWDATSAVKAAVAAGQSTLTLGLRNTDEKKAALGRHFAAQLTLSIDSDVAPATPVVVSNGGRPCATAEPYAWLSTAAPKLVVTVSDPDGHTVDTTFAAWPVTDPQQRLTATFTGSPSGSNLIGTVNGLADGGTYGWSAQSTSSTGLTSDWSPACYFHVDTTHPGTAPTITPGSSASPAAGIPARFTFAANGVADVAGYSYAWSGLTGGKYVAALQLGGSLTLDITPPAGSVSATLVVNSLDQAGNFSPDASLPETIAQTTPLLQVAGSPAAGDTMRLSLQPGVHVTGYDTVVSYSYTDNGGSAVTVPAAADGTATASIVLAGGYNDIKVTSTSSNGWVSPAAELDYYAGEWPGVASADWPQDAAAGAPVGHAGTFTLTNHLPGATTISYSFDIFDVVTIPIGADGTATITWTPTAAGAQTLYVYASTPDGTQSDWGTYHFTVGGS